jgi:hypothetical protein
MGCSVGRDAFIRVQGVGRYINTYKTINHPCCASLAPFEPLVLIPFCDNMADLFRRVRRSSSEAHNLLPAADSYRTTIASFMSISTLFAWTFGSGAVVCGRYNRSFLYPNTVWAIVLEDMAGGVDAHALCHWYVYESSRLFPDVMMITEPGTSDHYSLPAHQSSSCYP